MKRVIKTLKGDIHEEKEAIRDYGHQAKVLKKKHPAISRKLTHIKKEETHHKKELGKLLRKEKRK